LARWREEEVAVHDDRRGLEGAARLTHSGKLPSQKSPWRYVHATETDACVKIGRDLCTQPTVTSPNRSAEPIFNLWNSLDAER
jgi:hypothetical protein